MDKKVPYLKRGDDVRVKFATHDGFVKHCATVAYCTPDKLVVTFGSGFSYSVPHNEDRYERILG